MEERKISQEERARRGVMAKEYSDMLRKKGERHRKLLGEDLYVFLSAMHYSTGALRTDSALEKALRSDVPLSAWIEDHMKPAFGTMFHERDTEAILYWADHIREIPYTNSYTRRPFRSNDPTAYADAVRNMLRGFPWSGCPMLLLCPC